MRHTVHTVAILLGLALGAASLPASSDETRPGNDTVTVRPGNTLSQILTARGFGLTLLASLMKSGPHSARLVGLRPGDRLGFRRDPDGDLGEVVLRTDPERAIRFTRTGDRFESREDVSALRSRVAVAHLTVRDNLYDAARAAGLSNRLVVALAGVFEWDVDLSRDLRRGDRVTVVYEQLYLDGRPVRDGQVLAVTLDNRARRYRAVRYRDSRGRVGYYTPQGRSVQKAFLRSPIEFARVSSGFSDARLHPVLHRMRAHRGVDYAAPRGTPVRATGDGTVRFAGTRGGFGRTVVLAHGGQYATLYAHLSRLAPGIAAGARVRQGQVIGNVGSSGLATGPHLHYEFQVDGVHQDPVTVALPDGRGVPDAERDRFVARTAALVARLDDGTSLQVAAR